MRAAVSWTGGKDCNLALLRSIQAGHQVVALVIFHPPDPKFRAHPISVQQKQGEALGLPLLMFQVDGSHPDGYRGSYADAVRSLRTEHQIDVLVTGDIDFVGSSTTNFVDDVCKLADCGVTCWLPLWKAPREDLLSEMIAAGLEIRFSCVKSPHFDGDWVSRRLDADAVLEMKTKSGLDLTGENGEYHTLVLDGPLYDKRLVLNRLGAEELHGLAGQKEGVRWWAMSSKTEIKLESKG